MVYIPEGKKSFHSINENSTLKCLLIRSFSRRFGLLILDMKLLQDKVAIITGATRGIGRGLALRFAEEGAHVAFTYMSSEQKARELEAELSAFGVKAKGYNSDASIFAAAETLVNNVMADFGDLHIVVNNAGITKDGLLMRMSEEQFDAVIQTNLKSVFNLTKASIKPMLKNRFGVFINMSSVVGGGGNAGQANYAASKAGIEGFTKSVAQELGSRNIRSNAIAPGFIETEMTAELSEEVRKQWAEGIPLKRGGTPLDVANVAVFLASDLSAYVNGQVINVCGGMRM
jgi:3-oxoacyl-[acyl-carrier protein] reductase